MRNRAAYRTAPLAIMLWLALLLVPCGHALAAALPALTGRVVDDAHMIDPATLAAIDAKLAAYEKKSSDQIVVATIDSLDGEAIEPYANRLFRFWKLGQAHENNGILLLIAKNDHKMRIEVGYGLEGVMTDLASKLIIEDTLTPAFRKGDFSGGISQAVDDIISVLSGDVADLQARAARNPQKSPAGLPVPALIFILWGIFIFGGFAMGLLAPVFGRRIGPGRYRWLGFVIGSGMGGGWSSGGGGFSGGGGGFSGGGGGFSGGGGSSGGGGASGGW